MRALVAVLCLVTLDIINPANVVFLSRARRQKEQKARSRRSGRHWESHGAHWGQRMTALIDDARRTHVPLAALKCARDKPEQDAPEPNNDTPASPLMHWTPTDATSVDTQIGTLCSTSCIGVVEMRT